MRHGRQIESELSHECETTGNQAGDKIGDEFSEEFGDEFGDEFVINCWGKYSDSPNLVTPF